MKTREEYIDKAAKQLKEWSAKIDELETQAGTVGADMKSAYEQRIRDIKEKREAVSKKLHELKGASGDAWQSMTVGVDKAWDDFKDAFKSTREEYIDKMSKQLKEWSIKIDELESQVGTVSADLRTVYMQRIREIKDKRDALSNKLHELRGASGDAWKAMTTGVDKAWDEFKDAFKTAKDKFKKAA